MRVVAAVLLVAAFAPVVAADRVVVPGMQGLGDTRHHSVENEEGTTYHLLVRLPDGYAESTADDYPTVYILDGGGLYPLFSPYYRLLHLTEELPAMILVGISYGTNDWREGNDRSHDFTAPSEEREHWGGAADFQAFLAESIVPLIEHEYRSRPSQRVLFGHSLGGQFVIFSAQSRPDLFWGHIASNPALHRNLAEFVGPVEAGNVRTSLYVGDASNDAERFLVPRQAWVKYWQSQDDMPWRLNVDALDGHSHMSSLPMAFRRGLRWLFAAAEPAGEAPTDQQ